MKLLWTILFIASLITASAPAQEWAKARLDASPRHLEWVKVKDGQREVNCFLAFPERKTRRLPWWWSTRSSA
jgi:carboxymethylenebutenolidase